MNRFFVLTALIFSFVAVTAQSLEELPTPYSWQLTQPLGERYNVPMDTLQSNFYLTNVPSSYDVAYGYTGNLGAPGFSKIYFDNPPNEEFIFLNGFKHMYKTPYNYRFYNTRMPYSQLTYLSGGSNSNEQQQLSALFSGNVNQQIAVGGAIDYTLARGNYANQATKDTDYRVFASYIGDRYEVQATFSGNDYLVKENGGIADDNYILDPESMQGSVGSATANIPVNLQNAFTHVKGNIAYATQRYNLGFYREEEIPDSLILPTDTLGTIEVFVPVTSFIHTVEYNQSNHKFIDENEADAAFFKNNYYNPTATNDTTAVWSISNTLGVQLHEGFHKYAKMGLAAYVTHQYREYTLMGDTLSTPDGLLLSDSITPYRYAENEVWLGGLLFKRQGELLTYNVDGKVGVLGASLGEIDVNGTINSSFSLWGNHVGITAYGLFKNERPSFLLNKYTSNHFIWNNDFGYTRRLRVGGELSLSNWGTKLNIGIENVQNQIYFDSLALPQQSAEMIQVLSARLQQNFKLGALRMDNSVVYQTSSHPDIIPLPELSIYSKLYLQFPIAKVLHTQLGVDCQYNTSYYAQNYQPATATFYNQQEVKVGNYPLMNVFANMKLNEIRFFVLMSHVNQGLIGGYNSFSLPHYPLPPRLFQFGVSVDFAN